MTSSLVLAILKVTGYSSATARAHNLREGTVILNLAQEILNSYESVAVAAGYVLPTK